MKFDPFLLAMVCAIAVALLAPQLGAANVLSVITDIGVMAVFFLHGANLSNAALKAGVTNWRLHVFIQAATFVLFPTVGFAIYFLATPALSHDVRLGLFFLCALSSTISSSVAMTALGKGNVPAAVFNASLSGLIGMVVTPVLVGVVLASGTQHLPVLDAIGDIVVKLLAPFALGRVARIWIADWLVRNKGLVNFLDRGVIVLIVFTSFSESTAAGLWSRYGIGVLALIFVIVAVLLALVLTVTTLFARRVGFARADEVTAVFCGSKKSLANGAPIAKILFAGDPALGLIMVPLLFYHQMQLIVCSYLARRYAAAEQRAADTLEKARA